jgi:hypothetical protein
MKITIPETLKDITLLQFQKYNELIKREDLSDIELNKRKIHLFTGLDYNSVSNIKQYDAKEILETIDLALNQTVEFEPCFTMGGIEFGFIPNLDDITQGEFIDISTYGTDVETMHQLMAVLFRPIKKKDLLGNYEIIPYEGTKQYANIMQAMPMHIVNGALVFFSSLANELILYTQKFMREEQAKEVQHRTILKNGGGMQQLKNWLKGKFGKLKEC